MSVEQDQRIRLALEKIEVAAALLIELGHVPDPVTQRQVIVKSASLLRGAADELDQHGWIEA